MTIPPPLTSESDVRWFPVIVDRMREPGNNKIPWALAELAYAEYSKRYGTSQSLERIAERGGFGVLEIADYLLATIDARDKQNELLQEEKEQLSADGTGECYCDMLGETPCAYCQIKALREDIAKWEWLVEEMKKRLFVSALPRSEETLALHDPLAQANLRFSQKVAAEVRALTVADVPEEE